MSYDDAVLIGSFKLDNRLLLMHYCEIDFQGTIMSTNYPMNFLASNVKIIDYQNTRAGFLFETDCNYTDSTSTGEVVFENMSFSVVSEELNIFKLGSFIYYSSPYNLTIQNSVLNYEHDELENIDAIRIEDTQKCAFDDEVTQMITFQNNAMSFNTSLSDIFNNFVISFSGSSHRRKLIYISNNTINSMNDVDKGLIDVWNNSPGSINFEYNRISNCSTNDNMISLATFDNITIIDNTFSSLEPKASSILSTDNAEFIFI
jgi:hypothetical protein